MGIDYKHKIFCDFFIESFDFHQSCIDAKVQKNNMLTHLFDAKSEVSMYISSQMDIFSTANSYITTDVIKYRLGQIVMKVDSEPIHQIQAAKILLGYEDTPDKAEDFIKLVSAINKTKEIGDDWF